MTPLALTSAIREALPATHIATVARQFLAECEWELEVESGRLRLQPDVELLVYSTAIIISDHYTFGDHVEAIVYLGVERSASEVLPALGVLRLYLTVVGSLITEDRYSRSAWMSRR